MALSRSPRSPRPASAPGVARFRPHVEALGDRTLLSALPTPWQDADIGGPPVAGTASVSDGTFTVTGSGRDIGGKADQFNFLSRNLHGDGHVSARVTAPTGPNLAEAGVMSRDGTSADAPFVAVLRTPTGVVRLQWRGAPGATAGQADVAGLSGPLWLKIERSGDSFRGLYSTNNTDWTQVGSTVTVAIGDTARVGLAVASHDAAPITATADAVRVVGRPAAPKGLTATAGNGLAVLDWNPTPGATRYNVYLGTTSGGEKLVASGLTVPSYAATGLTNGTTYYVRVAGVNAAGEGELSAASTVTPSTSVWLNAPVPTAYAGTGLVTLVWGEVLHADYFNVYRGTKSGGEVKIAEVDQARGYSTDPPLENVYRDTTVANGTTYYYRVEAVAHGYPSMYLMMSAEVSARPLALADWLRGVITDPGLRTLVQNSLKDGKLDRADVIGLLRNVQADGGAAPVSADELRDLEEIVYNNNALKIPAPTRSLADKLVNGSRANAHYQGHALGDLSTSTTVARMDELIGKWFYGTDRPELLATSQYVAADPSWSLFGADGEPEYIDVAQGRLGDCYYLASLAAVAYESPQAIKDMFVDNGDGTYSVRFFNDGVESYVTVDGMLATKVAKYNRNDGEIWVSLAEKAYAQYAEEGWSRPSTQSTNAYASLSGGSCVFDQLTGKYQDRPLLDETEQPYLNNLLATNQPLFLANIYRASGLKVVNHAYAVIDYDPATKLYTLYNPWGFHEYATFAQIRAANSGKLYVGTFAADVGGEWAPPEGQADLRAVGSPAAAAFDSAGCVVGTDAGSRSRSSRFATRAANLIAAADDLPARSPERTAEAAWLSLDLE